MTNRTFLEHVEWTQPADESQPESLFHSWKGSKKLFNHPVELGTADYMQDHAKKDSANKMLESAYPMHSHDYEEDMGHGLPVRMYTIGSQHVNNVLLSAHQSGVEPDHELHNKLKEVFDANHPTKDESVVYSGVGRHFIDTLKKMKNGDHLHMPAYTSTSVLPDVAAGVAYSKTNPDLTDAEHAGPEVHILAIKVPKGTKNAKSIAHLSAYGHEKEVLLNAGIKLRKHGVRVASIKSNLQMLKHHVQHKVHIHEMEMIE